MDPPTRLDELQFDGWFLNEQELCRAYCSMRNGGDAGGFLSALASDAQCASWQCLEGRQAVAEFLVAEQEVLDSVHGRDIVSKVGRLHVNGIRDCVYIPLGNKALGVGNFTTFRMSEGKVSHISVQTDLDGYDLFGDDIYPPPPIPKTPIPCPPLTELELAALWSMKYLGRLTLEQHLALVALYPGCPHSYWETHMDSPYQWSDWGLKPPHEDELPTEAHHARTRIMRPYVRQRMSRLIFEGSREALYFRLFGTPAWEADIGGLAGPRAWRHAQCGGGTFGG